jgi:hypothetical protein
LLLALLPRGDYLFDPAQIGAVDADLHRATLPARVTLIDVSARFRALDGDIDASLYQPDRVHLTNGGYQRLAAGIRTPLEALLGP